MITESQLKPYLPKIFRPSPEFHSKFGPELEGMCIYRKETDSYVVTIVTAKLTTLHDAIAAICHEAGHISLDRRMNTPGSHFRAVKGAKLPAYVKREVDAWIEGDTYAKTLKVHKEYIALAISIMDQDKKYMRADTRQLYEEWINGWKH
jgi:hypothetical protein